MKYLQKEAHRYFLLPSIWTKSFVAPPFGCNIWHLNQWKIALGDILYKNSILLSWSFKMGYHITFLVKHCFIFVFFGHPAPVLRVIKMTLGNLDIWKIVWMLSQVSIGVKYVNKLIIPLYIFKVSIFDSTRGSFLRFFPFFPIYV